MERKDRRTISVELDEIFNTKSEWADTNEPRTLMIRGRAGIGKTTLFRKIVQEWSAGILWKDRFTHMYRFPLKFFNSLQDNQILSCRDLLMKYHGPNISHEEEEEVWKDICKHPEKILVLFDGLDEYRGLDNQSPEDILMVHNNDTAVPMPALLCNLQNRNLLPEAHVVSPHVPEQLPCDASVGSLTGGWRSPDSMKNESNSTL